ncbi:phage tail protein [Acinetobacter pittii]|uniref:Phage tail assembly protein n=1 Tax=Acinetobacter pittii TaxID=48296 RepID=A0A429K1V1_ACIPI|nr:phage tail assembly protein [Acinetobacter pittii]KQE10877.1 phage tail protein [Acinetobacter pittii]KRI47455.1 phage tail protein [Acinetobacter pittii]MDQ8856434.1 phage tail assembly protein [Acinetobacter pittii]MDQ8871011.1 phage tail assembly protein [Acinetobacter pittii]OTL80190.1 phage tail protein [Acinetobacter pittii]
MQTLEQLENTAAINPDIQTVDLEKPLLMGNLEIPSLEIRKPNVQALQGVKIADLLQGDVISICTVLPRICTPELTKSQINQLEPADLAQIGGVIMLFLQPKSTRVQVLRQQ